MFIRNKNTPSIKEDEDINLEEIFDDEEYKIQKKIKNQIKYLILIMDVIEKIKLIFRNKKF